MKSCSPVFAVITGALECSIYSVTVSYKFWDQNTSSSFTVPSGVMISRPCRARDAHRINLLHSSRSHVSLVIRSMLSFIHFVMLLLLLYDVFGLPRLYFPLTSPGSRTSPARTRRLSLCDQSRRVCDIQQILEAVWSCLTLGECFRLFSVQSN